MEPVFATDKTYEKISFSELPFVKGDYENCVFNHCDLSSIDLSDTKFIECVFTDCNLSNAKMHKTVLQDVRFKDCKMLGVRFDHCNSFSLSFGFENCLLDHSSFYQLKIKKTIFDSCRLHEIDFTLADLTEAVLNNCDLYHSTFDNTILEKADLRSAYNYSISPEINKIKKAKFSLTGLPGLLERFDIIIE